MSESSSHARGLAEAALLMAKAANDLSGWSEALMHLATDVSGILLMQRGVARQDVARILNAHCQGAAAENLSDSQRVFVASLAERNRLDLLPEIASVFRELLAESALPPAEAVGSVAAAGKENTVSFAAFDMIDIDAPTAKKPVVVDAQSGLESIGHLCKKVCGIWGSRELDVFLNGIVMDSRDGGRKGLPVDVASEVVFLTGVNRMVRAIDLAQVNKIKLDEAYRLVQEGDEKMYRRDIWDDPSASPGSVVRASKNEAPGRHQTDAASGSNLFGLVLAFVTNKFVIGIIIIALVAKYVSKHFLP